MAIAHRYGFPKNGNSDMKACYRYGQICPKQAKTAQNSPFRGYSGIGAARSWLQEAPPRDPGLISQRGHFRGHFDDINTTLQGTLLITQISEHVFSGSQHLGAAQTALTDPRRPRGRKGRFWGLFWAYFGTLFPTHFWPFWPILALFRPLSDPNIT